MRRCSRPCAASGHCATYIRKALWQSLGNSKYLVNTSRLADLKTRGHSNNKILFEIVRFTMLHIIDKLQASKYNDFGDSNKARRSLLPSGVLVFVGAVAGFIVLVLVIVSRLHPAMTLVVKMTIKHNKKEAHYNNPDIIILI